MSKSYALLLIPILLASGLYIIPGTVPPAHAAMGVGEVCIAKDGNTNCPLARPLINATLPPAPQLRIAVVVNASAGLNGFDITLLADHNFIKPAGFSVAGSIIQSLGSPAILAKCFGGTGTGCSATTDNVDTLHIAVIAQGITPPPTTGLLFTAIYNITGATYNIPINFQTGCGTTSVPGGVCVSITGGSTTPLTETIQTAKFSNRPYFDIQPLAPVGSLFLVEGTSDTSLNLNITSINNFAGTVTLVPSVSPAGPILSLSKTSVMVNTTNPGNISQFSTVTVTIPSTGPPGNYTLTFTGTSGALPPNTLLIPLTVPVPDFVIASNPTSVRFNVSVSSSALITVTSQFSFAGTVNLALSVPAGLRASLLQTSLKVIKGGSNSTTVNLNSTIGGPYNLNITGTSGTSTHKIVLQVTVLDFEMVAKQPVVTIPRGSTGQEIVNVQSVQLQPYNLTVTIPRIYINQAKPNGPTGPATGISVTLSRTTMLIKSLGTSSQPNSTACTITGTQQGNYTVTLIGVSGQVNHAVTFAVIVTGSDFTIAPTPTVQTVTVGGSAQIQVFIAPQLGLTGNVTLRAEISTVGNPSNLPTVSPIFQSALLNSTYPNATLTVTISTNANAATGVYTLLLTGFATSYTITHIASVIIVVTTTTSPHDLAVSNVTPSTLTATVGTSIAITIQVKNLGKANETSIVQAIAGDLTVAQQNITIAPGQNINVTLTWNTNGYSPGAYMIGGKVLAVKGETNFDNNLWRYATPVTLTSSNTSLLQNPYFEPSIIIALVAIVAIIAALLLQARRKKPVQ
jgi:hypothetical protein